MNYMRHSNADWRVEHEGVIKSSDDYVVAIIPTFQDNRRLGQDECNASLIAAAPMLLVACEGALTALLLEGHVDKEMAITFLKETLAVARNQVPIIA